MRNFIDMIGKHSTLLIRHACRAMAYLPVYAGKVERPYSIKKLMYDKKCKPPCVYGRNGLFGAVSRLFINCRLPAGFSVCG